MLESRNFLFTSESVSEGHPDKVADLISDAVLDAYLKADKDSRVACETLVKNNTVIIAGEIRSDASPNIDQIVRDTIKQIGYTKAEEGFDAESCEIVKYVSTQSQDISRGVDEGSDKELGAGDQGHMFGFACDQTAELMPLPIALAHSLVKKLTQDRKSGKAPFLRPDAKSQVSVRYASNNEPLKVETVLISTQHIEGYSQASIREYIAEEVIKNVIPKEYLDDQLRLLVNPTGNFVIGGPVGDCGLTGRKIIVDTYGGFSRHGGGAFSGKDPTKVDRSAAYVARYLAKNIVASGLAKICEIQLSYAIGVAQPTSIFVSSFGTSSIPDSEIENIIRKKVDLTPAGIIKLLELSQPIYKDTASYGHFGRTPGVEGAFTWEKTNLVDVLKS